MLTKFVKGLVNQTIKNSYFFGSVSGKITQMTGREAIISAQKEELERDPKVFLMGEEVALYNGAYKASKGLYDKFGAKRIWDTPISEIGFAGIGVGAALYGLKPIIEFMTWNFALQAIDHIVNSAAKFRYMSGGDLTCPVVFRGLNGTPGFVAAQHSQCFGSIYSSIPGLIVLAPYDAEDTRGLLKAAVRNPDPVCHLESENMYNEKFDVTPEILDKDFVIPIGKAKIMREGKDVTIPCWGKAVHTVLAAARELEKSGISVEVINLRTLRPLDRGTIVKSVKKTNRCVTVEEGWPQCGIGAEICALIMESSAFDYLDCPVERVTGGDAPIPYAWNLEPLLIPQVHNIVNAVKRVMKGKKLKN